MENQNTCGLTNSEQAHRLVHEISYQIDQGNLTEAQQLLAQLDWALHEQIGAEN